MGQWKPKRKRPTINHDLIADSRETAFENHLQNNPDNPIKLLENLPHDDHHHRIGYQIIQFFLHVDRNSNSHNRGWRHRVEDAALWQAIINMSNPQQPSIVNGLTGIILERVNDSENATPEAMYTSTFLAHPWLGPDKNRYLDPPHRNKPMWVENYLYNSNMMRTYKKPADPNHMSDTSKILYKQYPTEEELLTVLHNEGVWKTIHTLYHPAATSHVAEKAHQLLTGTGINVAEHPPLAAQITLLNPSLIKFGDIQQQADQETRNPSPNQNMLWFLSHPECPATHIATIREKGPLNAAAEFFHARNPNYTTEDAQKAAAAITNTQWNTQWNWMPLTMHILTGALQNPHLQPGIVKTLMWGTALQNLHQKIDLTQLQLLTETHQPEQWADLTANNGLETLQTLWNLA